MQMDGKAIEAHHAKARRACRILGTEDVWLHQFPDQKLDTVPILFITQQIEKHVERFKPEIVYTHWNGDLNRDHRIVSEATHVACRPQKGSSVREILMYEVPSSTEWTTEALFRPNVFCNVEATFTKKIEALKEYDSEMRDFPHPRSYSAISHLAALRGACVGLMLAEAFVLSRIIA